jgi:hypothetical protein
VQILLHGGYKSFWHFVLKHEVHDAASLAADKESSLSFLRDGYTRLKMT